MFHSGPSGGVGGRRASAPRPARTAGAAPGSPVPGRRRTAGPARPARPGRRRPPPVDEVVRPEADPAPVAGRGAARPGCARRCRPAGGRSGAAARSRSAMRVQPGEVGLVRQHDEQPVAVQAGLAEADVHGGHAERERRDQRRRHGPPHPHRPVAAALPSDQQPERARHPRRRSASRSRRRPGRVRGLVSSGSTNASGPSAASATRTPVPRRSTARASPSTGITASSARETPVSPVAPATGTSATPSATPTPAPACAATVHADLAVVVGTDRDKPGR